MAPMKKLATLALTGLLTSVLFAQEAPAPAAPAPETPSAQDVNYSFGVLLGQSLGSTGLDFDLAVVLEGIKDSMAKDAKPRIDLDQAKQIVSVALRDAQAKVAAAKTAQEQAWLNDHGKKEGVTTTASGLQYEALTKGAGKKPVATDTVKVNYVGTLVDGTKFDSSVDRGEPAVFPLNQVIPAWTEGIQLMGIGDKFRFTIPSTLAYGPEGAGNGIIPPYATLVFEVELLSIEAPEAPTAELAPAPAQ